MKTERITIRMEKTERTKIEELIRQGHYKSLAEAIREALSKFLENP